MSPGHGRLVVVFGLAFFCLPLASATTPAGERQVRPPACDAVRTAASIARPDSGWFLRLAGNARPSDIADLLGSYGIWCTRLERRGSRVYALTCHAAVSRIQCALDAVQAATNSSGALFPAIAEEAEA